MRARACACVSASVRASVCVRASTRLSVYVRAIVCMICVGVCVCVSVYIGVCPCTYLCTAMVPNGGDIAAQGAVFRTRGGGRNNYMDLGGAVGFRGALGTYAVLLWM